MGEISYSSAVDVKKLFRDVDSTDFNDNDIEFFVLMAESVVKGQLAKVYDLSSFIGVPPLVRYVSTELSVVYILERFYSSEVREKDDFIERRKKAVMDIIIALGKGELSLVDDSNLLIEMDASRSGFDSSVSNYEETFTHGKPENEFVDPDRLQDERDDRNK